MVLIRISTADRIFDHHVDLKNGTGVATSKRLEDRRIGVQNVVRGVHRGSNFIDHETRGEDANWKSANGAGASQADAPMGIGFISLIVAEQNRWFEDQLIIDHNAILRIGGDIFNTTEGFLDRTARIGQLSNEDFFIGQKTPVKLNWRSWKKKERKMNCSLQSNELTSRNREKDRIALWGKGLRYLNQLVTRADLRDDFESRWNGRPSRIRNGRCCSKGTYFGIICRNDSTANEQSEDGYVRR